VQTNFYYKYKNQTYEYKQLQALRVSKEYRSRRERKCISGSIKQQQQHPSRAWSTIPQAPALMALADQRAPKHADLASALLMRHACYITPNNSYIVMLLLQIDTSKLEAPVPWPSIHAPWYGYLFWIIAAAGNYNKAADATFVQTKVENKGNCNANMKVCFVVTYLVQLLLLLLVHPEVELVYKGTLLCMHGCTDARCHSCASLRYTMSAAVMLFANNQHQLYHTTPTPLPLLLLLLNGLSSFRSGRCVQTTGICASL
jgi:hypothetical protein